MKRGQQATTQYSELVSALQQVNAEWIVTEVEEVIARGKEVPFRDLSAEENALYENRLIEEIDRGVIVKPAKANDAIGVPYEPHERLTLLVEAVERVITTSELSRSYISKFAEQQGINSIGLENPVEVALTARAPDAHSIPLEVPTLANERLSIFRHVLHDEVLS